ncbi:MAG: aspartate aminotransferase family protein [Ktedonobacteraceae bacterium]
MILNTAQKETSVTHYHSPFSMDEQAFLDFATRLVQEGAKYLYSLQDRPVYQTMPQDQRVALRTLPLPEQEMDLDAILTFYTQHILPYGRGQQSTLFAAFVDPAASPISIGAEFMSAITNTSGSGGDYAMIYVEETAVRWLMQLVGFPVDGSDGVLLTGGSDANRHCIEVARYWGARKYGWNIREEGLSGHSPLTLYVSGEQHSCVDKAAYTLGLGEPRIVGTNHRFEMDVERLRTMVSADRAKGHLPFLVVASAGTVKTGAIDPLETLADFCEAEGLWLHVDGAFGGLGAIDPRLAKEYRGLERANSLAIDPHKWLAVAIGCSCAMVREGQLLLDTFTLVPSYLRFQSGKGFGGERWYSHRSSEQTRPTGRALKTLWNIQQAGRDGLIAHIQHHIDCARYMELLIRDAPELELVASGPLTAVCFRVIPRSLAGNEAALNILNQMVVEQLQVAGKAFLAGVEIRGVYALRSCALHYQVTNNDVSAIVDEVRRVAFLCLQEQAFWQPLSCDFSSEKKEEADETRRQ